MAVDLGNFFGGSTPTSVTNTAETTSALPAWYQEYQKGIMNQATQIAAQPYVAYQGPRIAGLTPEQKQAQEVAKSNVGSYKPYIGSASDMYEKAAGLSAYDAGSPLINEAAAGSALSAANPYFRDASATLPGSINDYMSPYTAGVVDEIGRLGNENLMENILPGINDTFTGSGMFGGTRHADFTNRAVRDASRAIAGEQRKALESGYGTAGNLFNQDQSRLVNIGSNTGSLATNDLNRKLSAGSELGRLTTADQNALLNLGTAQGNLGELNSRLGVGDVTALTGAGLPSQALTQANLDLAYKDFADQQNYSLTQLDMLNRLLRGQNIPSSSTTSYTNPGSSGSLASGVAGLLAANKSGGLG